MKGHSEFTVKSRIWIHTEEGAFLGLGRVALLQKIGEHGSISKAALDMKMSYKKAWELVNSMNSQNNGPLVTRKIGGKGGGGSELTEFGRRAIKLFTELETENQEFLNEKMKKMNFGNEKG